MTSIKVTPISPPMILGEGPHWIEKDQSLIFVDHPGGFVNRIYTQTGRHQILKIEGSTKDVGPSVIIPVEGDENNFIIALGHDLTVVSWPSSGLDIGKAKPTTLLSFDQQYPNNSLNDAKVDPSGRLWAGTKGFERDGKVEENRGSLYRINKDLKTSQQLKQVTLSNGLTWSSDSKTFFYIDSPTFSVDAFDYDDQIGEIRNRRTVLDYRAANMTDEVPDGMTIDLDGNLWVACYNGGKVLCIDPQTGVVLRKIVLPSRYTTSCAFGGQDYSTLYVTSATRGLTPEELSASPDSGKTFAITGLGAKGSTHRNFQADLAILGKVIEDGNKQPDH